MQTVLAAQLAEKVRKNIEKVVVGKQDVLEMLLAALVAGGHVLLEDVPGTGKTVLAHSLARSVDCGFSRIQLYARPDAFRYHRRERIPARHGRVRLSAGARVHQHSPGRRINRATPRTQSALLECMEERQVTDSGVTRRLNAPFLVIATQNPVEIQERSPCRRRSWIASS